ncbi:hypothetical protein TWF694_010339 [Orbilia ellipsospora]|uniref:Zn(2)-C6 fungal-type domain-containing protein n=1 Tax=Orbilia ellipsospora TaxID=2528407 RepID=A0AAV9XAR4_9PEZI
MEMDEDSSQIAADGEPDGDSPFATSSSNYLEQRSGPSSSSRAAGRTGRRNLKSACQNCKNSKRKCSGPPPPCEYCQGMDNTCVFDETADLRRTDAQQRVLESLIDDYQKLKFIVDQLRTSDSEILSDKIVDLIRSGDKLDADSIVAFIEEKLGISYQASAAQDMEGDQDSEAGPSSTSPS